MKIKVKVKTGAKTDFINFDEENNLCIVSTKTPPIEGEANVSVIKLIAEYFKVPKSNVKLKTGPKSKIKIFEINDR